MSSASVSGLDADQRKHARELIEKACATMVKNKTIVHYSQGYNRQVGVRSKLTITKGQYPKTCDCSSTAYWMLWDALKRPYGVRDLVAGANWNPDGTVYTGSMYTRGKAVVHDANHKVGDCIFYGNQGGGIPEHVAMSLGGSLVFSHGSEGGPYILNMDYRGDRRMTRRYI